MPRRRRWVSCLVLFVTLLGILFPNGALADSAGSLASTKIQKPIPPFGDVLGTEYQDDVGVLWKLGVAGGTSETTFSPWDKVTRAQAAAFVIRTLRKSGQSPTGTLRFSDVPTTHYAVKDIMLADELGIIKGVTPSTFDPDGKVTHVQLATMLLRALGYEGYVVGEWPVGHILKAVEIGLVEGIPFEVNKEATRAETARFLVNAIFKVKDPYTGRTLSQSVFRQVGTLFISPDTEYVTNREITLSAQGLDWFGNAITLDAVQWSVAMGSGTITGNKLTFSDAVTVQAQSGNLTATHSFKLAKALEISAPTGLLRPNQTTNLTANIVVQDKRVPVSPQWSVVSGPATVSDKGAVTITGNGTAVVKATYGALSSTVSLSGASDLVLSPATPVVGIGESISFSATAAGAAAAVPVTWSVVSGDGTITQSGLFTAGRQTSMVRAAAPGFTANATVQVINRLEITPSSVTLSKAESASFTVKAYTSDNQLVSQVTPTWELSNKSLGIADNGTFVATGSGTGTLTARYRGLSASATLQVSGDPVSVLVSSSVLSLPANGVSKATLTARIVDRNGIPVKGSRTVTFSLSNGLATLEKTLVTTETGIAETSIVVGSGAGTVTAFAATPGLLSGNTQITLLSPTASKVILSAYPATINADHAATSTITATIVDSAGQKTTNLSGSPLSVTLYHTGTNGTLLTTVIQIPHGGQTASAQFRSNANVGTTTVSGSALVPVESTTIRTAILGPAAKLSIRPPTATEANNTSEMTVAVEVQDSQGVIRSSDSTQVVNLRVSGPDSTLSFLPTNVLQGVATFRVRTSKAGQYTFTATSGDLAPATATGEFAAGRATKLLLSAEPVNSLAADNVSTTTLVAKVVDAQNNLVTTFNPAVIFRRSTGGNAITWNGDVTVPAENGVARLTVKTTGYPGTESFTASASSLTTSSPSSITTSITGVAAKLRVQSIDSAKAGGSTTVKVYVLDTAGKHVTSDNERQITLASNSSFAVTNSPQVTVNGVATFTLSNNQAESVKITATGTGVDPDENGQTVTFIPGSPERIILVSDPSGIAASSSSRARISAYAVDALGNRLSNTYNVTLSLSSAAYGTLSQTAIHTFEGSAAYFTPSGAQGSFTISGTSALPVTSVNLSTYQPGTPARVVLEVTPTNPVAGAGSANQITVKARILDSNGNLASWLNSGLELSHLGILVEGASATANTTTTTITSAAYGTLTSRGFTPDGVVKGAVPFVNGEATLYFTNTKAQTVTLVPYVWYNSAPFQGTSVQVTTLPGPATQLVLNPSSLQLPATSETESTITVTVADRYGNPVAGGSETIRVSASRSDFLTLPAGTSFLVGSNGTVTIPVKSRIHATGGTTRLTLTAVKTGITSTTPLDIITDRAPDAPLVSFPASTVTNSTGSIRVYVDARSTRNAPQKILLFVNGMQVNIYQSETAGSTNKVDEIAPGTLTAAGYVRIADLGGPGVKTVQAYVFTDLGISPAGPAFTLTVNP